MLRRRARVMQLLTDKLTRATAGPKLQLSDAVAPVLKPLVVTLASCTAVLEGADTCCRVTTKP